MIPDHIASLLLIGLAIWMLLAGVVVALAQDSGRRERVAERWEEQ